MRPANRTDFDAAFTPGTVFVTPDGQKIPVGQVQVADLILQSGAIAACDPSYLTGTSHGVRAYTRGPVAGKYPVTLCVAWAGQPQRRVACAMVRFSPDPVARWEMAVMAGQDASKLPEGRFFGFGVDAGMGCFIDMKSVKRLETAKWEDHYNDRLLKAMQADGHHGDWGVLEIDPVSGGNLVAFSSGWGDGVYPCYWGLDAADEVCCLVADFGILVEFLSGTATFRLQDWIAKTLAHPDLTKLGFIIRIVPMGVPPYEHIKLEMEGGHCKAVIASGGVEYSSDRLSYSVVSKVGRYDFHFEAPLAADAELRLAYGMGTRALAFVNEQDSAKS